MEVASTTVIRDQLLDRRGKLQCALAGAGERVELVHLLGEVDAALQRLDLGTYGVCAVCNEPIESDRLLADPLVQFCLDHLSPDEQRSLEQDLELAARIQRGLLPDGALQVDGWQIAYDYQPARIVSGDYCDIVTAPDGGFYFMLGDVSGKGVAASMLMAHLNAMFRTLVSLDLPLNALVERASRAFCESTLPTHYATLVCGRASTTGEVEVCNAGHLPVIVAREAGPSLLASTSLPIGMFCSEQFKAHRLRLASGETMVLVSDGVTELENSAGEEFGIDRVAAVACQHRHTAPGSVVGDVVRAAFSFAGGRQQSDDMTVLAIQRQKRGLWPFGVSSPSAVSAPVPARPFSASLTGNRRCSSSSPSCRAAAPSPRPATAGSTPCAAPRCD